jgi:L-lactate dehydrogenase complex protein LldF
VSTIPASFYRRVDEALAQPDTRRAVKNVAVGVMKSRAAAIAALDNADDVRDRARRIRAQTLARLDHYLDRFVENVEARGGHVFYAHTGEEAVRYVCDLARARGVRLAVKSKSMISEEIELNHALEGAGIDVVETDLGEYVVQLDNDRPSHIVAPILHKTKADVARVFRDKLGATDEDVADVPHMTQLARRVLRDAFLRADMGISGVNFGVADTGSICICTNEGNGRLTTTLPRVHVAMMGIERLVPSPDDLGVMLQVLARSGTGQKLTVYSNVLTGPRRAGEDDGPEELHVVLVDNGRTKVLGSELAEILYCIRCGACLYACPVYQTIGGHAYGSVYSGPVGSVLTPGLHGVHAFADLPHASSLCGACREVCPVRIDIPRMLLKLREVGVQAGESPLWVTLGMKALRWSAVEPPIFRGAGRLAAWLSNRLAQDGWLSKLPGHLRPWTDARDFPAMARESFRDRWKKRPPRRSSSDRS